MKKVCIKKLSGKQRDRKRKRKKEVSNAWPGFAGLRSEPFLPSNTNGVSIPLIPSVEEVL